MLQLQSQITEVNKSPEELFDFLENLKNIRALMPDNVQKFEADDQSFLFALKGMPDVRLLLDSKERPHKFRFKAASSKLDFTLVCNLTAKGDKSQIQFDFEGNFNPMMRMMVERPLKNFIEELSANAAQI